MEKILVTGGFGFLGGHLVKKLVKSGYEVVVFDSNSPVPGSEISWLLETEKEHIEFVKGNITDISSVFSTVKSKNITKIFHAAVINDLDILANNPMITMKVNLEGTLNVLEAARIFELEKIIIASSISVYTSMKYEPMDENHPVLSPDEGPTLLSYSSSKLSAEAFMLHYCSAYGLDAVALRFSGIYGFGMKYPMFVKPMVENAARKENSHFPWGEHSKRDYTYIYDVINSILLALNTSTNKKIYNISTGRKLVEAKEIAQVIERMEPKTTISFGNERNEVEERSAKTRGVLSIEAAKSDFGFFPKYSINQGISDYLERYKEFSLYTNHNGLLPNK